MFTANLLRRVLFPAACLTTGFVYAQPYGPPQPGYPQASVPPTAFPPASLTPAAFPAANVAPPVLASPAIAGPVIAAPPVRLGFQFAMCDFGMAVNAIREGGLAQQVGLLPGDIIVQINTFAITGWDQYCMALHDAVYARAGQVEMWLYRPTPAGYELQYVAFTIHEEQIIVVVPCSYHHVKCHDHHVSCWSDRLVWLNDCWKKHCHHGGKAHDHHGLNIDLLGKGVNFNLGNAVHGATRQGLGGKFGDFNPLHPQHQFKSKGASNFQQHIQSQLGNGFNSKFKNFGSSNVRSSHGGGGAPKNFSSQFGRSGGAGMMKSFGGFGKK